MDFNALFRRIDALQQEYLQFWVDVCNIESPTNYKPGVDAVGKYFAKKAEARGWEITVHHEEVSGDAVCITMNPHAPGKAICFSGHMDTVHPVGSFGNPAVRTEGDTIYGPGVKDCKGGAVAGFMAMAALADCGFADRPVKLILQSDEENSSMSSDKGTTKFMAEMAKGCEVFLNTEGHEPGKATLWRKGIRSYRMVITGKANHAARSWEAGVSAIREAAYKILQIEQFKERDGITMNCGLISGGSATNAVPERCELTIDVRYPTIKDMEKAETFLQELTKKSFVEGSSAELISLSKRLPMEKTESNCKMLENINEIYAAVGLPVLTEKGNPGGSDAADMTAAGIVCIDSLGVVGDFTHSIRERAEIPSLAACAKRLAAVAAYLK